MLTKIHDFFTIWLYDRIYSQLSVFCIVIACFMIFSLFPEYIIFLKAKKVFKDENPLVPIFMWLTCVALFYYGVITEDITLISTNLMGMVATVFYLITFTVLSTPKLRRRFWLWFFILTGSVVLICLLQAFVLPPELGMTLCGATATASTVGMYVSPLAVVIRCFREKSTRGLSQVMNIVALVDTFFWVLYSLLIWDLYVMLPFLFGLIINVWLATLFIRFRKKSRVENKSLQTHDIRAVAISRERRMSSRREVLQV